jgi:hypothetical protein
MPLHDYGRMSGGHLPVLAFCTPQAVSKSAMHSLAFPGLDAN